ncbi:MAG: succinate dehydrogenase, hydrophobic membrane anchor protein [Sideroxydans sp. RIFOXYD2_FULL_59_7]|nr:MAG: succinate dehydrogenase, hydrophobic membrane anchor protein [Sideroxydans sp. RIFOXYD2_FULL_59_7]
MVNRIVTGAHYGLRDWLVQRVSAVVMAAYVLAVAVWALLQPAFGYDVWTELFSGNLMRSFSLLFLLNLFYHAWIGVRDIVMDYVKLAGIRLLIHVSVILSLIMYVIWAVQILWGL